MKRPDQVFAIDLLLTARQKKLIGYGSGLIFLLAIGVHLYILLTYEPQDTDFLQDYTAAQHLLEGQSVYAVWNPHPPLNAILFSPLAGMSLRCAYVYFGFVSLVLLFVSLGIFFHQFHFPWYLEAVLFSLCYVWPQHFTATTLGALSSIMTSILILALVLLISGYEISSGMLFSLAMQIKLYPVFLMVYFIVAKKWRVCLGIAVGICVGTILTISVVGKEDSYIYFSKVLSEEYRRFIDFRGNFSLAGVIERMFGNKDGWTEPVFELPTGIIRALSAGLNLAVFFASVFFVRRLLRQKDGELSAFSLSCVAMFLLSPIAWGHYVLVMVIPMTILFREQLQQFSKQRFIFLALGGFLISGIPGLADNWLMRDYDPQHLPFFSTASSLCYTLGLLLLYWLIAEHSKNTFSSETNEDSA